MVELEVGVRIHLETGVSFFGTDEVNALIRGELIGDRHRARRRDHGQARRGREQRAIDANRAQTEGAP